MPQMHEQTSIWKLIVLTVFRYVFNRQLVLRTIMLLIGVSSVTIMTPKPVLADILILQTRGNGTVTPTAPSVFPGNSAQFQKSITRCCVPVAHTLASSITSRSANVLRHIAIGQKIFFNHFPENLLGSSAGWIATKPSPSKCI